MAEQDARHKAMAELYREEVSTHGGVLSRDLLRLEALCAAGSEAEHNRDEANGLFASLLRAAHSLKGAARIMRFGRVAEVSHALEDALVWGQRAPSLPQPQMLDALLTAADFLNASGAWQPGQEDSPAVTAQAALAVAALRRFTEKGDAATGSSTVAGGGALGSCGSVAGGRSVAGGGAAGRGSATDDAAGGVSGVRVDAVANFAAGAPVGGGVRATDDAAGEGTTHLLRQSADGLPPQTEGNLSGALPAETAPEPLLRVRAELVNDLLQLGAQGRVLSHRMDQLPQRFLRLSEQHLLAERTLDACSAQLAAQGIEAGVRRQLLAPLRAQMLRLRELEGELYEQTSACVQEQALLSERWYAQVLACRTRPFADIVSGFPRLVRDIGRQLGKQILLHVEGAATLADRDIMEKLEMPLVHLLRNACSHGIETPSVRLAAGKGQQGVITLSATHSEGWLQVSVRDDGHGIDLVQVRKRLEARGLPVDALSEAELLESVFTQGFSTLETADAVSGRGVGLAAVRNRVHELGGRIVIENTPGKGSVFTLHVPVTRALLRVLCVRCGAEPYALPLGQIESLINVSAADARARQVQVAGRQLAIVSLAEALADGDTLETDAFSAQSTQPPVSQREPVSQRDVPREDRAVTKPVPSAADAAGVEGDAVVSPANVADVSNESSANVAGATGASTAGMSAGWHSSVAEPPRKMIVLRLRGRRYVLDAGNVEDELELIVHELDARLGRLPLLQAAGINELGEVVLVLDVEGLCERMAEIVAARPPCELPPVQPRRRLRVLLAEDTVLARARIASILAEAGGFELTSVPDGLAAWQRLQSAPDAFDLLLTDLEMPGMDGCELVRKVRSAPAPLATLPVVIISARDGDTDRCCGADSGANLYLSKHLLGNNPAALVEALIATAAGN